MVDYLIKATGYYTSQKKDPSRFYIYMKDPSLVLKYKSDSFLAGVIPFSVKYCLVAS